MTKIQMLRKNHRLPLCLAGAFLSLTFCAVHPLNAQRVPGGPPIEAVNEDGAEFRWLHKEVFNSRELDNMEDLSRWSLKGEGEMALSGAPVKEGKHSIQIRSTFNIGRVGGDGDWQDLVATRKFPSEDWTHYNRLSIWVYPDVNGAPALSASLVLHNEGTHILPDNTNEGRNDSIPLKNHEWNHVVWEIPSLARDKVTAVDFGYGLPKMLPDPGDKTILYIDQLTLESVAPDHVEGWEVAPDKIAFSHAGYLSGSTKTAIANGLASSEFSLVDADTGKSMLTRAVEQKKTALGTYQLLDFSEVQRPGRYLLRSGAISTQPFRIGDDAWRNSILKAINFMYSERCGTVIPGIHGICHQDDYSIHGDKRIVVNGGYHDAGDLTATGNTPGMSYALFELADRLKQQGEDQALYDRVIDEAKWGLNWILKTRFGDGYRTTGQLISYWTNGIMGDADDRFGQAVNDPEWNFRVAAVEALAARVLRDSAPELAHRSLATAQEDWTFAIEGLERAQPLPEVYGQKDELERISFGATASIELFKTTGEQRYADAAIGLADQILASQERTLQPWAVPLTGYFYTGPHSRNLFHRFHVGEEEQPIVALAHLCDALPNDPHWIKWYSAVVLHSRYYQQPAAQLDAPYDMLPAAVYQEDEVKLLPQSKNWTPLRTADRDVYLEEVHRGMPLGNGYYLRRFPVWFDFRGNSSVLLSEAKALSVAGQLRGDIDTEDLAQRQAQWIVGRNPFSASIMYGEGYDWTPLYSVRSGQMVGAIPVGIETRGSADVPYWPAQACWTYKEVWTQPVGEWVWLMHDLSGPGIVRGFADPVSRAPVQLVDQSTGITTKAILDDSNGHFRAAVPQGHYVVEQGGVHLALTVLSAGSYDVDLRPDQATDFSVDTKSADGTNVVLHVSANGAGTHTFSVRADNLEFADPANVTIKLGSHGKQEASWHAHIANVRMPWVAVILEDGATSKRKELTGIAHTR